MVAGPRHRARVARPVQRRRFAPIALVGAASSVLLTGCSAKDAFAFGWPKGITPQATRMYDMWIGSTIAALVVGVFVWGLIFWCVIRYRKKGEELPPQTRYNLPIEVMYSVAPFLVVAVLFYYTAVIQTEVDTRRPNPDVTVEVVGFKWNWQFRYLDAPLPGQPDEPVTTTGTSDYIPVLVLPTNRRIRFIETSRDVIHSFWVPDLLFKRDVIPGYQNKFEVTKITTEGAYVGRCAELCGTYHSMMNFELRAVSPEKYDQFIKLRQQGLTTPQALEKIGEEPYAVTTKPFDTDRTVRTGG